MKGCRHCSAKGPGGRALILPGPGRVEVSLPPGSICIPLEKAPSGHLVMVVDEYEKITASTGGIEDVSLSLHAERECLRFAGQTRSASE